MERHDGCNRIRSDDSGGGPLHRHPAEHLDVQLRGRWGQENPHSGLMDNEGSAEGQQSQPQLGIGEEGHGTLEFYLAQRIEDV